MMKNPKTPRTQKTPRTKTTITTIATTTTMTTNDEAHTFGRRPGEWRQDAPPMHGIRSALGRARKRKLEASLTQEEWIATLTFFKHSCAYCQKAVWCLVDHVTSLDRGGGTT